MDAYDIAIVGAGIVGLSTARALAERRPDLAVVVVDKEPAIARHQTGRNSGVIHSGIYYAPGSAKARYARDGAQAMEEFCRAHGVPVERCGKVIVATRPAELAGLAALELRAAANGIEARRIGPGELREREPHVRALAALLVPATGITDYAAVAAEYARIASAAGTVLRLGTEVLQVADDGSTVTLEPSSGSGVRAGVLINCAGLHSDRLARAAGIEPPAGILPFRGEYFDLTPEASGLVRSLVYPVPDPAFPFLGAHLTRGIHGDVHAGPNAVLALRREGYRTWDVSARDVAEVLRYPGFWRLARRHWRAGAGEYAGSLSTRAFVRRLRRMVPELGPDDLVPGTPGVRAQAVAPDGRLVDDFLIVQAARSLHVLNAPSPAATASLPIGDHLADLALARLPGVAQRT